MAPLFLQVIHVGISGGIPVAFLNERMKLLVIESGSNH